MSLRDILRTKGNVVHTIGSDATLEAVVQSLVSHNCGSLIVCDPKPSDPSGGAPGNMVGIITERDILKASATNRGTISSVKVADVMTRDVTTGSPDDSVEGVGSDDRPAHPPSPRSGAGTTRGTGFAGRRRENSV